MSPEEFIKRYKRPYVFHFTDLRNLPSIREHGLLSLAELHARGLKPARPGGNEISHALDKGAGLDKYVHLCLIEQHPMEFVAQRDGRIGETRFLKISTDILRESEVMGCDTIANASGAEVLMLADALDVIDHEYLFEKKVNLSIKEELDRFKAAKKAQLLIPNHIATKYIRNLD